MKIERYRVEVNGIVQGVGFRPFVYKLAMSLSLKGMVRNTAGGVLIEIEGPVQTLDQFVTRLRTEAPPLAQIDTVKTEPLAYSGYENFTIIASSVEEAANTLISPDISICSDCGRELFDPADHRYLYPFINCTNCGPRYTIIRDVPYDRHNTTMREFPMCPFCGAQYGDPYDRRYHAQPVCCHDCGPGLYLLAAGQQRGIVPDIEGVQVPSADRMSRVYVSGLMRRAVQLLADGKILAIKGIGGYHLVCDAASKKAVEELRKRKHRDEKPFALMARDLETARKYCAIDEEEERLLLSPARPIVLLAQKPGTGLPEELAPGNPDLGIMLPYTPLHLLLFFNRPGSPSICPELLVMTSGNRSSEPICFEDEDAFERLKDIADYFLTNNRPIRTRTDDSVVRAFRGGIYPVRRSRGYAPTPVIANVEILPASPPSVLAVGGELKSTFCITKGNRFFVSQHIGDLENLETMQSFEDGIEQYKRLFDISPTVVAYDLHPGYLSTGYAQELQGVVKIPVQHHHAHPASCMAENGLSGEVIGVAMDGTGYGEDGCIWGGEFFTGSYARFERAAHLEYFRLPGSEAAVREPWRSAASCLHQCGFDIGRILKDISADRLELAEAMLERKLNSPLTSSMGRLFDAVAAIAGIRNYCSFEGQAAMELEYAASGHRGMAYPCRIEKQQDVYILGIREMIKGIVGDAADGVAPGIISAHFHETVACLIEQTCLRLREDKGLDRVVLSGGVFQNMRLLAACMDKLQEKGFQVFIHRRVPTNDGGISLGQAAIAVAQARNI